jgi:hypothetical protein
MCYNIAAHYDHLAPDKFAKTDYYDLDWVGKNLRIRVTQQGSEYNRTPTHCGQRGMTLYAPPPVFCSPTPHLLLLLVPLGWGSCWSGICLSK